MSLVSKIESITNGKRIEKDLPNFIVKKFRIQDLKKIDGFIKIKAFIVAPNENDPTKVAPIN